MTYAGYLIAFAAGKDPQISSFPQETGLAKAFALDPNAFPIREPLDCKALSTEQMIQVINFLRQGKPIKAIKDKSIGAARVWALLSTRKDLEEDGAGATVGKNPTDEKKNVLDERSTAHVGDAPSEHGAREQTKENTTMASRSPVLKKERETRAPKTNGAGPTLRDDKEPGEGKAVRAGSSLARIVEAMIDGDKTLEQIAKAAGVQNDQAGHRIRHVLHVNHGVGYKVSDGKIKIVFPKGFGPASMVAKAKE
jgi:hypothetical protein